MPQYTETDRRADQTQQDGTLKKKEVNLTIIIFQNQGLTYAPPPDTPTHSREGLIQVIAVRLDNLHADVSGT